MLSRSLGETRLPVPIPWDTALSGLDLYAQGGALELFGSLFGLATLTPELRITVGD